MLHLPGHVTQPLPNLTCTQVVSVRFLADDAAAPAGWLSPKSVFALFEGRKKVAEGAILEVGN